ncbi:uncharacterized protein LOC125475589 [Pyrus x bretschneideri]|uniref:uncharacterized protein LOC125475589 n=1 Tax=Pyrus x bretschneideri TaxID=225117 RepID=UPI00202E2D2C|nr:uncharacterized protein LOC125475589 [Pyrus x bretschneideri]
MKIIFCSHELWDLVENGYETPMKKEEELTGAEKKLMRENVVKDARALGIIQGAVSDQIFPRIATQESAKVAWDILKQEFVGDKQVRSMKLQGLRRDFEYIHMNDSESLSMYIAKLFDLINQMRSYGEDLSNQRIFQKLLISLPKSYDSIAAVVENTKDLDTIDAQDVVAILKGYEQRLDKHGEGSMEKAFASLNIASKSNRFNGQTNNGKYQKNFRPKRKQWSNKADWGNKASFPVKNDAHNTGDKGEFYDRLHYEECWVKNKVKCHKCSKIGRTARYYNANKAMQQVNFANQVEETGNLLYANHSKEVRKISDELYIDSGCSNHMTSKENLLVDIDRRVKAKVQVGIGALVEVAGKRTLIIETMKGRRYIKEVMLVSGLVENLLSVGQMTEHVAFHVFKKFKAIVELQCGYSVKRLRKDRGEEFTSNDFGKFCEDLGIERQLTVAYSPQHNGVAERKNMIVVEMAKYVLKSKLKTLQLQSLVNHAVQDEAWKKAMEDEMSMIEKNQTWELVRRPFDKLVIGVNWVYKTKLKLDGSVQKNKARLVAKGYAQKPRVNYNETLAPVARLDIIRTLIALAAKNNWKLFQLDVKSAFLNGVLEDEVYVDQPDGFIVQGNEDKV